MLASAGTCQGQGLGRRRPGTRQNAVSEPTSASKSNTMQGSCMMKKRMTARQQKPQTRAHRIQSQHASPHESPQVSNSGRVRNAGNESRFLRASRDRRQCAKRPSLQHRHGNVGAKCTVNLQSHTQAGRGRILPSTCQNASSGQGQHTRQLHAEATHDGQNAEAARHERTR